MDKFPEILFPSATEIAGPTDVGYGVYQTILTDTTKEDYEAYLSYLNENGFVQMSANQTVNTSSPTDVSTYRKNDMFVSLRHAPGRKTWIAYYKDEEYHTWSAEEAFVNVPNVDVNLAKHVGDGNYMVSKEEVSKEEYVAYGKLLGQHGFEKVVDNGNGLGKVVFHEMYRRGNQTISICYLAKTKQLYVSACLNAEQSKHLQFQESYIENIEAGAKTTLTMLKMTRLGSSFVFQLKNGHYIVSDGGFGCELEALLQFLEQNAPNGEKPVIEAWLISHTHPDHSGVVVMIAEHPENAKRISVEGIYYNEPCEDKQALHPALSQYQILGLKDAAKILGTKIYRPQTGQRYYFCDITMDVMLASEQVPFEVHSNDFNDTSTWFLFTIDGQTCLIAGDADKGASYIYSEIYEKNEWKFNIFTAFHHGSNTDDHVTEHSSFETILVPRSVEPQKHPEENQRLKEKSKEWFIKGNGTRVLTFPYKVGESKLLEEFDMIYDEQ